VRQPLLVVAVMAGLRVAAAAVVHLAPATRLAQAAMADKAQRG
jgi:hypothetical protein